MLRLALLGLVVIWCASLTRLVCTWRTPVALAIRTWVARQVAG